MIKKIDNDSRHVRLLYKKDHDNLEKKNLESTKLDKNEQKKTT